MFVASRFPLFRLLTAVMAGLVVVAAIAGIISPVIYQGVVPDNYIPGSVSQDIVSLILAVATLIIAYNGQNNNVKLQVMQLGLTGFFFYAYGIYSIESVFNYFYFLYLAILSLSVFSLIVALAGINYANLQMGFPRRVKYFIIFVCVLVPVILTPVWVSALLGYIGAKTLHPTTYSVFVLDLCFIFPAFFIAAWMLYRNRVFGLILAGLMIVLGFTLLFSVVLGDFIKPFFGQTTDYTGAIISLIPPLIYLAASIVYFYRLKAGVKAVR